MRVCVGVAACPVRYLHLVNLAASRGVVLATFDAAIPTWLAPSDRRHLTVIPS